MGMWGQLTRNGGICLRSKYEVQKEEGDFRGEDELAERLFRLRRRRPFPLLPFRP